MADRLTGADYGGGSRKEYTYDPAGNLLSSGAKGFTYDDASRISGEGYDSDSRGHLTAAPGCGFVYDGAGRLTSITADGNTVTFTYNGLGDLRTRSAGGRTTTYYHNHALGLAPVVAEKEGGTYKRLYVHTPGGRLLYSIEPSTKAVRFYHFDRIGSTLFLTDGDGAAADTYAYDPYGNLLSRTGTSDQPFTFVGRQGVRWEPVGHLYQMRARYYDPATGRFLTRDPVWPLIRNPQGLDPYTYAAQNPLRYVDPRGTCSAGASAGQGLDAFNESAWWWLSTPAEEMTMDGIITLTGEPLQPGDVFYDPDFDTMYEVVENVEGGMIVNDLFPNPWKSFPEVVGSLDAEGVKATLDLLIQIGEAVQHAEVDAYWAYAEQYGSFPGGMSFEDVCKKFNLQFVDIIK